MSVGTYSVGLGTDLTGRIGNLSNQIATGSTLNNAQNNPSGIQVSIEHTSEIRGNSTAIGNINDGLSALEVAEGGISSVTDSLQRIRELAVQSGNGTLNSSDRDALQKETNQLLEGIRDAISGSQFNGQSMLDNTDNLSLQSGADAGERQQIRTADLTKELDDLNLFSLDLSDPDNSANLERLDSALSLAGELRSEYGAARNTLEFSLDRLVGENESATAAQSRLADTDIAAAASEKAQADVQQQVQIALLGQANASKGQVLSLLNF